MMKIPQSLVDEVIGLMREDESTLVEKLGQKLIEQDTKSASSTLGVREDFAKLQERVKEFFLEEKEKIKKAVCGNVNSTEMMARSVLAGLAVQLGLDPLYSRILPDLAALIMKKGIDSFCKD